MIPYNIKLLHRGTLYPILLYRFFFFFYSLVNIYDSAAQTEFHANLAWKRIKVEKSGGVVPGHTLY